MDVARALHDKNAYPEKVSNVEMKETHISWVFLTGKYAYKVKKPKNYGFLDFTTLKKRKYFCEQELKLNRRLCKDLYLSVLPITKSKDGLKINGSGKIVDYALKMRQLPQERIMGTLLREGKITEKHISKIAKILAHFHARAETGKRVNKFGSFKTVKFNWDENFSQTYEFIGKPIHRAQYDRIRKKIDDFMEYNKKLFTKRVKNAKIRDCHGDLHSGNIFIADKTYIFDAIEFNQRFRYSDVASEIAFMAMDLDFHGKHNLAQHLVHEYVRYSGDEELLKLLNFYKCYRAYIRGKVMSFLRNDEANKVAQKYFTLAERYAKQLITEPTLVLTCGLIGSGKSWFARGLARYGDFHVLRSDEIRKKLAKTKRTKSAYGKGYYTQDFTERTYIEMLKQARKRLDYQSVILDATFSSKDHRDLAEMLATVKQVPFIIAYCSAPEETVMKRIRGRRNDVSDANVAIYNKQKKEFAPPKGRHVVKIDTTIVLEKSIEKVFNSL